MTSNHIVRALLEAHVQIPKPVATHNRKPDRTRDARASHSCDRNAASPSHQHEDHGLQHLPQLSSETAIAPATALSTKATVARQRAIMMKAILARLQAQQQRQRQAGCNPHPTLDDPQTLMKVSQRLEELLYRTHQQQHCQDHYYSPDPHTIDERLQTLLITKLNRRMVTKSKRNRSAVLRKLLGQNKYTLLRQLVQEIKQVRNQTIASFKCCGNSIAFMTPTSALTAPAPISFSERLPQVAKDVFFHARLVDAFDKLPIERLPSQPWDEMICKAQDHLQRYRAFMKMKLENSDVTDASASVMNGHGDVDDDRTSCCSAFRCLSINTSACEAVGSPKSAMAD